MYHLCAAYVPPMCCLCTTYVLPMYHLCAAYVPPMCCLCTTYVLPMYHLCAAYVPPMFAYYRISTRCPSTNYLSITQSITPTAQTNCYTHNQIAHLELLLDAVELRQLLQLIAILVALQLLLLLTITV
jgi:hypothetical protein